MLMSLVEGEWAMPDHEGNEMRNPADAAPAVEKNEDISEGERIRTLQDLARKMDRLLLSWAAKRRPKGGEDQC